MCYLASVFASFLESGADEVLVDGLEVGLVTIVVLPDRERHLSLHRALLAPCTDKSSLFTSQ